MQTNAFHSFMSIDLIVGNLKFHCDTPEEAVALGLKYGLQPAVAASPIIDIIAPAQDVAQATANGSTTPDAPAQQTAPQVLQGWLEQYGPTMTPEVLWQWLEGHGEQMTPAWQEYLQQYGQWHQRWVAQQPVQAQHQQPAPKQTAPRQASPQQWSTPQPAPAQPAPQQWRAPSMFDVFWSRLDSRGRIVIQLIAQHGEVSLEELRRALQVPTTKDVSAVLAALKRVATSAGIADYRDLFDYRIVGAREERTSVYRPGPLLRGR